MIAVNYAAICGKFVNYFFKRKLEERLDNRIGKNIKALVKGIITSGKTVVSEAIRSGIVEEKYEGFFQQLKKYYYFFEKSKLAIQQLYTDHLYATGRELGENPLVMIDYTAIEKKYSKKIENIQNVWDGSQKKLVRGIKVLVSCALTRTKTLRMLMLKPSSSRCEDFKSENNEIVKMIVKIHKEIREKAIYIMDRGMDHVKIMEPLLERWIKFIIRLRTGNNCRHLEDLKTGKKRSVKAIIERMEYPYKGPEIKFRGKRYKTRLGVRRVRLPNRKEDLYLVVSWIEGVSRLALLTNVRTDKEEDVRKRVEQYIKRFVVEEVIRFLKKELGMDTFMVRSWEGIEKMLYVLVLAADFVFWIRRMGGRWLKKLCFLSKPIFPRREIQFIYYQLRLAIRYVLMSYLFDTG